MHSADHDWEPLQSNLIAVPSVDVQDQKEPAKDPGPSLEILVPHLVAMTLMLATVTLTPNGMWNTMTTIVAAMVGPTLFALSLAAGVCGLTSYAVIWLLCARSSRAYRRSVVKQAKRAAERAKRHRHAA